MNNSDYPIGADCSDAPWNETGEDPEEEENEKQRWDELDDDED